MDDAATALHCSPSHRVNTRNNTCFSHRELSALLASHGLRARKSTRKNLRSLRKSLDGRCGGVDDEERCWLDESPVVIKSDALQPPMPIDWDVAPTTWLSNFDIARVMLQFEEHYTDWKFLGVFPINFGDKHDSGRCIGDIMCDLSIDKLKTDSGQPITRFGAIFNLDPHYMGGSHWTACFCDFKRKPKSTQGGGIGDRGERRGRSNFGIYYYDSTSNKYGREVETFMDRIKSQVKHKRSKFQINHNQIEKQFKDTECGMFSMVFLIKMLEDSHVFSHVCESMGDDDDMTALRRVLYDPRRRS